MTYPVFVCYDSTHSVVSQVCRHSITARQPDAVVSMISLAEVKARALYYRQSKIVDGVTVDSSDGKPFSTEFSFSRFLVPILDGQKSQWALGCDDDLLFLGDVADLFALADPKYAVMVVKHEHHPTEASKFNGTTQTRYHRKNWSSLILWNCQHPSNRKLSTFDVSNRPGSWLHAFGWLKDDEIGALPESWNWLVGVSPTTNQPLVPINAFHYTNGGPWYESRRNGDLASVWIAEKFAMDNELDRRRTAEGET